MSDAVMNGVENWNRYAYAKTSVLAASLDPLLNWANGFKAEKPIYPYIGTWFLRRGDWNKRRRRLESRIQVDVWTSQNKRGLAWRIANGLLDELGFETGLKIMEVQIPQLDYAGGTGVQLIDMILEYRFGFEPIDDPTPRS